MITTNYSQANVSLSGSVGLNTPNASQTVINKYLTSNGANQNIHTVTAGKTFYLMGFSMSAGSAANMIVYKNDGTTIVGYQKVVSSGSVQVSSSTPIWSYASTENVVVNCATGMPMNVWGFEQ